MKILITGAKGQLGNELCSIISKGKSEIGKIPYEYKDCVIIATDVDELDITNTAEVLEFVKENKPDIIFNCAAMTNVDGCETQYETAFKINAMGVRNLSVAAERVGAKFVHISTDYVFAGDGTKPYAEWDTTNPQSIYGKSKRLGEEYALQFCKKTFVVRTSWLYGYVGKNFVKTMRNLGRTKDEIKVVNDQRGNPTNANDLAHHLLKLGVTEEYGIYHCTGEGECTWYVFAKKIMEYSNLPCRVNPCTSEEFPSPTKRPAFSSLNNLALKCTVGNEMRNWEEALKEYISKVED
ncbi:MAG: dTDP-4-dehydrorhamnose reductase [Clostridia bacterium]|nr:dTDP-4-dehydrorhamnose reductase [Clostridia bacterium]